MRSKNLVKLLLDESGDVFLNVVPLNFLHEPACCQARQLRGPRLMFHWSCGSELELAVSGDMAGIFKFPVLGGFDT